MMSTIKSQAQKRSPFINWRVNIGDIVVVANEPPSKPRNILRFAEGGYQVQETPHFLLFFLNVAPGTILVHWFAPEVLNADIKQFAGLRIKAHGIARSITPLWRNPRGFVASFFPQDVRRRPEVFWS